MSQDLEQTIQETPVLTLEPFTEETTEVAEQEEVKEEVIVFTPEEEKMIADFSGKIDLTSSNMILQYGAGAQKKMADFSETALTNVKTKDLGEVGDMLADVMTELRDMDVDEEEEKGFFGFFKKNVDKLANLKAKYNKAETNVEKICKSLQDHQVVLLKDIAMLDKMYSLNMTYFKELSMYIEAGKRKLEDVRTNEVEQLRAAAVKSGLPEDAQKVNDLVGICDRFEKKLHDLELTRAISLQMSPQIRLVQGNDMLMSEKIQSTLVNTIPLWKSQMVLAIGVENSARAADAQREVTNMTNELLRKNAEKLKTVTIDTAKESERGIVDIETLKTTNQALISTLDEVMKIQEEGKAKRRAAEQELNKIEGQLKQKLLEIK